MSETQAPIKMGHSVSKDGLMRSEVWSRSLFSRERNSNRILGIFTQYHDQFVSSIKCDHRWPEGTQEALEPWFPRCIASPPSNWSHSFQTPAQSKSISSPIDPRRKTKWWPGADPVHAGRHCRLPTGYAPPAYIEIIGPFLINIGRRRSAPPARPPLSSRAQPRSAPSGAPLSADPRPKLQTGWKAPGRPAQRVSVEGKGQVEASSCSTTPPTPPSRCPASPGWWPPRCTSRSSPCQRWLHICSALPARTRPRQWWRRTRQGWNPFGWRTGQPASPRPRKNRSPPRCQALL